MKLSLADKLALIYTSAGSLRKVAGITGLSRHTVTNILKRNIEGGSLAAYESKPHVTGAVDVAFDIHKDLARGQAQRDRIPFNAQFPVFAERLPLKHQAVLDPSGKLLFKGMPDKCLDYMRGKPVVFEVINERTGEIRKRVYQQPPEFKGRTKRVQLLGERVGALHLHWLSDKIRNAWLISKQKSGKYYAATAGSIVNLREYNKRADARAKLKPRNESRILSQQQFKQRIKESDAFTTQRVYTQLTSMDKNAIPEVVIANITDKLQTRHEPATGQPGTVLGDQILLQLDTRRNKHAEIDRKAGRGKAPGNRKRN